MPAIKAIRNHIVFRFENSIAKKTSSGKRVKQFEEVTDWGFEISSYDEGTKAPRWGIVISVGHEVIDDIQVGSRILIEPLAWTEGVEVDDITYWRTDDAKVMAIDEDFQL
jgi:hypothetical protein